MHGLELIVDLQLGRIGLVLNFELLPIDECGVPVRVERDERGQFGQERYEVLGGHAGVQACGAVDLEFICHS